jgi:hypothetical protein
MKAVSPAASLRRRKRARSGRKWELVREVLSSTSSARRCSHFWNNLAQAQKTTTASSHDQDGIATRGGFVLLKISQPASIASGRATGRFQLRADRTRRSHDGRCPVRIAVRHSARSTRILARIAGRRGSRGQDASRIAAAIAAGQAGRHNCYSHKH